MANFIVTPTDTTFTVQVGENTLAAANSAANAAASAVVSDTAADRSEAARDVAIAAGVQYPTEAAAVAAIADGAFASYLDADGNPVWGQREGSSMVPLPGPWIGADKIGERTVAQLFASTELARGEGAIWRAGGFRYVEAASDASDQHITTEGGVKLYALRNPDGSFVDRQFGVTRDGVTDDTAALNKWAAQRGKLTFTAGVSLTTDSILFDGETWLEGCDAGILSYIRPAADVLEGVKVGSVERFEGKIDGLLVSRAAYSGATENIGIRYYDVSDSTFENVASRNSKYNHKVSARSDERSSYNTFININGTGGFYNLWVVDDNPSGFANENTFLGGRMFTTANTDTNVLLDEVNHVRLVHMSVEGTGQQAIRITGSGAHSNVIECPRTEGTWAVDDIVIDIGVQNTMIIAHTLYTSVTDDGSGTTFFTRFGNCFNGVLATLPVLTLDNNNTADAVKLLQLRSRNFTANSKALEIVRNSDALNLFHVTGVGRAVSRLGFQAENATNSFSPIILGTQHYWVNNGVLRSSNGAPGSATAGFAVGKEGVAANVSLFNSATSATNTSGKAAGVMVFDLTTGKPLWATGATATSTWVDAVGNVVYTPS